jgi:hypothetical protein
MSPNTPDRFPGPRQEDELQLTPQDPGTTPSATGGIVYADGAFKLRDAVGDFDPRSGGGGITEAQHEVLDTLIHWISESNWQEFVRESGRVTSIIHWTDSGKTKKVRELLVTRSSGRVSQIDVIQYDGSGVERQRLTGVITRASGRISSVDWTRTGAP